MYLTFLQETSIPIQNFSIPTQNFNSKFLHSNLNNQFQFRKLELTPCLISIIIIELLFWCHITNMTASIIHSISLTFQSQVVWFHSQIVCVTQHYPTYIGNITNSLYKNNYIAVCLNYYNSTDINDFWRGLKICL